MSSSSAGNRDSNVSHFSLRMRILFPILSAVAVLCVIVFVALSGFSKQASSGRLAQSRQADAEAAQEILTSASQLYQCQADTIINQLTDGKGFQAASAQLSARIEKVSKLVDTEEEVRWAGELRTKAEALNKLYQEKVLPLVTKLANSTDTAEAASLTKSIRDTDAESDQYLSALNEIAEKMAHSFSSEAEEAVAESAETIRQVRTLLISLSVACVVIATALGLFITSSITRNLRSIAAQLSSGAEQTVNASTQVASASQTLADGATQQAASLEETSASLEELSSMTKNNAESSRKASAFSAESRTATQESVTEMQALSKAMEEIRRSSSDIEAIIKTIDEIAFQTNILALNAAVEAARAGEAGAGFAVVADEVRNLAQRASSAASETSGKIEGAIARAAEGERINARVASGLAGILEKVHRVDSLLTEVAAASNEQSQGIQQLNGAIGQIDKITQANAASAEESAAASEELSTQARAALELSQDLLRLIDGR